ncbi:MAG: DUF4258 domain-containing protein [Aestuariivirga sp.]
MQSPILSIVRTPPSDQQLVPRIRALVGTAGGMRWDHKHFQQRMKERDLNMRQVLETIKEGAPMGPPTQDEWGDWRVKLRRVVAGRLVRVVIAVKNDHFVIVTVF